MTTYISTAHEAKQLASGAQTLLVTMVKSNLEVSEEYGFTFTPHRRHEASFGYCKDPTRCSLLIETAPYKVGQSIAVREPWYYYDGYRYAEDNTNPEFKMSSPATMPRSAARTWLTVEKVECVRVREMPENKGKWILPYDKNGFKIFVEGWGDEHTYDYNEALKFHITAKFGQSAWDDNAYVFLTSVKLKV